jgi:hypothetical protein
VCVCVQDFSKLGVWAMQQMAEQKWAVFFDVLLLMSLRYTTLTHSLHYTALHYTASLIYTDAYVYICVCVCVCV